MLRRLFKDIQGDIFAIPGRLIAFIFLITLFFIPLLTQESYILFILILVNIFVIFAVSWDFISGYTGQINFGHAFFFGVAAYTSALLNLKLGLPPWATIPIGALASVVAGLIVIGGVCYLAFLVIMLLIPYNSDYSWLPGLWNSLRMI